MVEKFDDVEVVVAEVTTDQHISRDGIVPTADIEPPPIKRVVAALASGLSAELRQLEGLRPDEIEVKLSLALSAELKAWVLGAKGEQTFAVTLKWKGGDGR